MPAQTCSAADLQELLLPFYPELDTELSDKFKVYLDLLLRWNARTNLSAVRTAREIVERHFGESLFAAQMIPDSASTLLDLGSGAGFPGLPIALARPALRVTLAESQGKKASFLCEAVRTLAVQVEVWPKRIELMPSTRRFDVVTLRAVDRSDLALQEAKVRVAESGVLLHLTSSATEGTASDGIEKLVPRSARRVVRTWYPRSTWNTVPR